MWAIAFQRLQLMLWKNEKPIVRYDRQIVSEKGLMSTHPSPSA